MILFAKRFLTVLTLGAFCAVSLLDRASATAELDIQNRYGKIGLLLPADNLEGWLALMAHQAAIQAFKEDGRFQVEEFSKIAKALGAPKAKYRSWLMDPQVLKEFTNAKNLNVLLRTRLDQENEDYLIQIELLDAKTLAVVKKFQQKIHDPYLTDGNREPLDYQKKLYGVYRDFLKSGLFLGEVTGRDGKQVTFVFGQDHKIKPKDTLEIATIDIVRKHPIDHEIESYKTSRTGFLKVESVDETGGFGTIDFEETGRSVARFQKIVAFESYREPETKAEKKAKDPAPELGFVGGRAFYGSLSRDSSNGTTAKSGSAKMFGVNLNGELWFNPQWFAVTEIETSMGSYKDSASSTGKSLLASSWNLGGGRKFFLTDDFFGPNGFARLRYHRASFSTSLDTSTQTSKVSLSGLLVGVGVDVPVMNGYGVMGAVDLGLFVSGSEKAGLGSPNGGNLTQFQFQTYRWMNRRLKWTAGLNFKQSTLDLANNGSVAHKIIAFEGGVLFYF